jgi:hypothetical protein
MAAGGVFDASSKKGISTNQDNDAVPWDVLGLDIG